MAMSLPFFYYTRLVDVLFFYYVSLLYSRRIFIDICFGRVCCSGSQYSHYIPDLVLYNYHLRGIWR